MAEEDRRTGGGRRIAPPGAVPGGGGEPMPPTSVDERTRPRARPPQKLSPPPVAPSAATARESSTGRASRVGPVPEASHGGKTRTQRVVASLQRDMTTTIVCVALCVVAAFLAIWLYAHDHVVAATVVGLAIFPISFTALFVRRAPCPKCGHPITIIGIDQCDHCREYIRVDGNQLKVVEVGYVAAEAVFAIEMPLATVPRLSFPVERCCVCGEPPTIDETLDVQGTRIDVPHCGSHEAGVVWSVGLASASVPTVTFRFRSFDYWRAVRQANWMHLKTAPNVTRRSGAAPGSAPPSP